MILIEVILYPSNNIISTRTNRSYVDLSDWDFESGGIVRFDNEWQLISTKEFDFENDIVTYRLQFKVDPKYESLAININYFGFWGEISLNNKNITRYTTKTLDKKYGFSTSMGSSFAVFETEKPIQELEIRMCKNYEREQGTIYGIYIGSEKSIFDFCLRKAIFHYTSLSLILIFGFYYSYLYIINRVDSSLLYFGISNIAMGVVYAIANTNIYNYLFQHLSYLSILKITTATMNLFQLFICLFLYKRNKHMLNERVVKIFVGCNLVTTILVCISNTKYIYITGQMFRFVNLFIGISIFIQSFIAICFRRYNEKGFKETYLVLIASLISCIQYISYIFYLNFRIIEILRSSAMLLYVIALGAILLLYQKNSVNQNLIKDGILKDQTIQMREIEQGELILDVMCYIQPYITLLNKTSSKNWIAKSIELNSFNKEVSNQMIRTDKTYQILISDQDATSIVLLKKWLSSNFELIFSYSKEEILQQLSSSKQIELVLLGEQIEGLSSNEICKSIRQKYSLYELPILAIRKKLELEEVEAGLLAGVNDFVILPLHAGILHKRLENMIQLKESVQSKRKMEAVYLQNQIKPHFLFNALSVIISLCYIDNEKAGDLLEEFSNYLHITFTNNPMVSLIPLEKELSLITSYIKLEKARYGERLQMEFDIESTLLEVEIPALLVQPLVENAIKHGIMKRLVGGIVRLIIAKEQNKLQIMVQDNGVGIDKDVLEELNKSSYTKGIGLKNIQKRLMNEYNEGLTIKSNENEGTTISLRIPMV